jgi:glycosyltransferase involved in cell wall biosynthesis
MSAPIRMAVLAADSDREADGIRDYSNRLVGALQHRPDVDAAMFLRPGAGGWVATNGTAWTPDRADAVVLQYNPFSFGRRGFAPGLVRDLVRLRRRGAGPVVAMMVHETYVDMKNVKWAAMGAWQRAQMAALRGVTDVQFGSIERWVDRLRRWPGGSRVYHLPVPSNFPDRRADAAGVRAGLGVADGELVLTCFGLHHPGRLVGHVQAAAEAVASAGIPATVLNLGPGEARVEEIAPGVMLRSLGYLPERELAGTLACSDIFLAPFADGVSTRRTTVMSALQHAIPVVGTDGHLTDGVLREASGALRLVPVQDRDRFAAEAARLAQEAGERRTLGDAGRHLYTQAFDWPVVVDRLIELTRASAPGS